MRLRENHVLSPHHPKSRQSGAECPVRLRYMEISGEKIETSHRELGMCISEKKELETSTNSTGSAPISP